MQGLFRAFRIVVLLSVFAGLASYAKTQKLKSRSWYESLQVVIYPMNGEDSPLVNTYINQLQSSDFSEIDTFFQQEAEHYNLSIKHPTQTQLGAIMHQHPPTSPHPNAQFIELAWWAIKFRYWAFRYTPDNESNRHRVRVFVHYHEADKDKHLQHSLGLDKGLLAIVHAFAAKDQEQQNNIIIAHEFLHTVGASDKYNPNNQPVFPDGYAAPSQRPLFPQFQAEIMAAKIPLSASHSIMAESLSQCIIAEKTATEINWLQNKSHQ